MGGDIVGDDVLAFEVLRRGGKYMLWLFVFSMGVSIFGCRENGMDDDKLL